MRIDKNRHMIILHTLNHADEPVTAEQLAHLSMSSLRTVKSDVAYLSSVLEKENTARIVSLKAKGYKIEPIDEDNYRSYYSNIDVLNSLFHGKSIESESRRLYILQRLLIDDYVKIDSLAEDMYLSRSSLTKDFNWAVGFLESYHIKVCPEAGKGYYLDGKEQDMRSALVELHTSQYHEYQTLYPYQPFNDAFNFEGKNYYDDMRHAFLDVLRASRIVVSDIASKKLSTQICLMKNRIAQGKTVVLDDDVIGDIREFYDYEVAKNVFANPVISSYVQPDENEILNFARLLIINRDINMRVNGPSDIPLPLIIENARIFQKIIKDMDDMFGGRIHDTDIFKVYSRDFESLQMQLYLKYRYDYTSKYRMVTYVEGDETLISPVPMELTRTMITLLSRQFKQPIRDSVVFSYAALYERVFKRITYSYKKLRLMVTSTEGLVYSQQMKEYFLDKFSDYIANVDVYNLYEMRKLNFDDYDFVVHSGFILYYNYPVPAVGFHELDYESNSEVMLFEQMFITGYDRRIVEFLIETMNIISNTNISDVDNFIEALSYRYGKDNDAQKAIVNRYYESRSIMDYYSSRKGIILMFLPYGLTERNIVDIYLPNQTLYYERAVEVKAVIMVSADPRMNLSNVKLLDHTLRYLLQVDGAITELINDKEKTLNKIFDRIVRRRFLNP